MDGLLWCKRGGYLSLWFVPRVPSCKGATGSWAERAQAQRGSDKHLIGQCTTLHPLLSVTASSLCVTCDL